MNAPATPATYRLFVAVAIPPAVKSEIEKALVELRRALPGSSVRWGRPEQFHLTLRFLGEVPRSRVDDLGQRLLTACERCAPLRLVAGQIGFFPGSRFPRVIWAGISDTDGGLRSIYEAVDSAVAGFTDERGEEPFTGHVTLGRVRHLGRTEADRLAGLAQAMAERRFGEWTATSVELIRSELSPAGSRYTTLVSCGLAGAK